MTTREFFERAMYIDNRIKMKLEQVQHLKDLVYRTPPSIQGDKVKGGSGGNYTEDIICKWVDAEAEIDADIDRLIKTKAEIEAVINRISDERYRMTLELRYLGFKRWNDVADDMGYDVRHVHRLHKAALRAAQVVGVIEEETNRRMA